MSSIEALESKETIQEMEKMLRVEGCMIRFKYGYVTISNGKVVCKFEHEIAEDDTNVFIIAQITCTAVVLLTCHRGKIGSIYANYDSDAIEFRENYDGFGNIYLDQYYGTKEEGDVSEMQRFKVMNPNRDAKSPCKFIGCGSNGKLDTSDNHDASEGIVSGFTIEFVKSHDDGSEGGSECGKECGKECDDYDSASTSSYSGDIGDDI